MYGTELDEALRLHAFNHRVETNFDAPGFRLLRSINELRPAVEIQHNDENVWLWSDLHLEDANALDVFNRPFEDVFDMNRKLLAAWRKRARPGDLTACLGDVGRGPLSVPTLEEIGRLPTDRLLIFGNHDRSPRGFDQVAGCAVSNGDPPLLLTHTPLREAPAGTVNVHGHLHRALVADSTAHVNVCVEQLEYQPVSMASLRLLARRLVGGWQPRGETTSAWIEEAGAVCAPDPSSWESTAKRRRSP